MASSIAGVKNKVFQRFTAVDLVTIAVFAVLYRALWYVWNALAFLFPFNQLLNAFFYVMCGLAAMVIVRKVGTATLFLVVACLINVLVQGESLAIVAVGSCAGLLGDIYAYFVVLSGRNPFTNRRDMWIIGGLMSLLWNFTLWVVMVKFIYMLPLPDSVYYPVIAVCLVAGFAGGIVGFWLGNRVKGLIG
jgi:hypothetical protein